jgi:hypothetical protein
LPIGVHLRESAANGKDFQMLKTLYTIFGIGVVSLYSVAAMLGWELGGGSRRQLPPDARQNGYRSFHFWHYGLRGGK